MFGLKEIETADQKEEKRNNAKNCAVVVRLSDRPSDRSVNLLLDNDEQGVGHFYLVNDTKKLLQKLICEHCSAVINNLKHYTTHVVKCVEGRVRHVYPGGFHKQPLGISEKLESVGVTLPENLYYYQNFICYDFESMFKGISKKTEKNRVPKPTLSCVICHL